ncbi:hypothetical protein Q3G72_026512 [Acer saccharum]|nr:hypothetical protein Q3G72_026512 [Acer saccharum]
MRELFKNRGKSEEYSDRNNEGMYSSRCLDWNAVRNICPNCYTYYYHLENWDKQVVEAFIHVHILLSGEQFAASMSTLALASRDVLVHAPAEAIGASAEFYT